MYTGWTGRVMAFLNYATQLVVLNFLWILGTLLGGFVLGVAPATLSLGRLVTALSLGDPSGSLWRDFWSYYFAQFWSVNKQAWVFTALAIIAGADLYAFRIAAYNGIAGTGALLAPFIIVALLCVVANAYFHASRLRFRDTQWATLKFAFLSPLAFLPATLAIILINIAFFMLTWQLPITAVLIGFSVPLGASIVIAGHAIDRAYHSGFLATDRLLTDADSAWRSRHEADPTLAPQAPKPSRFKKLGKRK